MSTKTPTLPSAQAPAVAMPSGALVPVWFQFLSALLAVVAEQGARIDALEKK